MGRAGDAWSLPAGLGDRDGPVGDVNPLPLDELEERVEAAEPLAFVAGVARGPRQPRLRRLPK